MAKFNRRLAADKLWQRLEVRSAKTTSILISHVEPGCVADEPQEPNAPEGTENAFVQKLKLNEPFRIIISMRVEKESDPTAEGGNVSPQCVRGAVG